VLIGTIVRLPPYDPLTCPHPTLVSIPEGGSGEGEEYLSPPLGTNGPPVRVNDPVLGTAAPPQPPPDTSPATTSSSSGGSSTNNSTLTDSAVDELDLSQLNGPDEGVETSQPMPTNIVSDAASGYASPPPPNRVRINAGIFIMGAVIFFVALATFGTFA